MDKLLLLSVLFVGLYLPIRAAKQKDQRRAVRRLVVGMAAFNCVYAFLLLYVYTRIG